MNYIPDGAVRSTGGCNEDNISRGFEAGMSVCPEFTQNAWRKELCANCQKARSEHSSSVDLSCTATSSPKPTKRTSVILKSGYNVSSLTDIENGNNLEQQKSISSVHILDNTTQLKTNIKSALNTKKYKNGRTGKVFFADGNPDIIGCDGGLDNLYDDDEDSSSPPDAEDDDVIFSEEEKQFAMLALENTLWNGEIQNLRLDTDKKKTQSSSCKEFEDIHADLKFLCNPSRFHNLKDCDALPSNSVIYGTFPVRRKNINTKETVENYFSGTCKMASDIEFHRIADSAENADSESSGSDHYKASPIKVERVKTANQSYSSMSSESDLSSNSETKTTSAFDEIAVPYKIVSVITRNYSFTEVKQKEKDSYTMDDITECLYGGETSTETNKTEKSNVMTKSFSEDKSGKKPAPNPKVLKKSVSESVGKNDCIDAAGMEAVDMLNDVLSQYSDGDDLRGSMSKKDKDNKAKKSAAFEAKMASVAANLDLQKPKGKRPAPRPPVSPPPEPKVSPTKNLANKNEQEPFFKMVPLGKPIMTSPAPEVPEIKSRNDSTASLDEHLLANENGENPRLFTKTENGKSKRGITSFFRNILRRGKESPEPIEPSNPDITLMKAETHTEMSNDNDHHSEEIKSSPSLKRSSKFSPKPKFRVLPPTSVTSPNASTDSPPEVSPNPVTASPTTTPKSKSMSSPKLKHDRVTFSPPIQHKKTLDQVNEETSKPEPVKPIAAPKPSVKSGEEVVVRRRAKSPKRTAPPVPPPKRTSIPNPNRASNANNPDFAKELERRLSRPVDMNTIIEARRSITSDKMGPPPSPPKACASPVLEEAESEPSSPTTTEIPEESRSTDNVYPLEKIELPTADKQARKNFLGKLAKPKQRAPQPPSVKRAKSINDSTLPRIEKKNRGKKINVADISGPVLVTDVANKKLLENRRNTISLGDEPAFSTGGTISLESESCTDNSFEDLPIISPLGSLENLYEAILPKFGGRPHWYDPVKEDSDTKPPISTIPIEGYLEPIATANAGLSIASSSNTLCASQTSMNNLNPGPANFNIMTTSMIEPQNLPNLNNSGMSASFCASSTLPRASKNKSKKMATSTMSRNSTMSGSTLGSLSGIQTPVTVVEQPEPPPVLTDDSPKSDIDEERRNLLASQPIYEEINGYYKLEDDDDVKSTVSQSSSQVTNNTEVDTLTVKDSSNHSQSKETLSSESDTQSTCSTLSRPRPVPRRRPKRPDTGGSDQYVSMNRPNTAVTLGEERLRDVYNKLTGINLKALQDVYSQTETMLSAEKLTILHPKMLKWQDFDVYGQPLHSSERCIVYNAKYKATSSSCQLMLLHSRPATEMSTSSHPSLLKPVAVFADTIPFVNLSEEFIKTSQVAQNSIYDTNLAKCFVAVGSFDIIETLDSHVALLKETLSHNLDALMHIILTLALQLLSAMSHCLDQGYTVTERDFRDVFLLSRGDLRGKVIAFLPHQRSHDAHQGEAMCTFIDRLFKDVTADYMEFEEENETLVTIENMRMMLEPKRVDCLAQVRSVVEYLLWGPNKADLINEGETADNSIEQELSIWLEKERALGLARFAKTVSGISSGVTLDDYYRLKFLLKSSAVGLAESIRRLS